MKGMWFSNSAYIDFGKVEVIYSDGTAVPITGNNSFRLLLAFAEHPGEQMTRRELVKSIWDQDYDYSSSWDNSITRVISDTRKLINDKDRHYVITIGSDYKFSPPDKTEPPVRKITAASSAANIDPDIQLGSRYIQSQLIFGIRILIDSMDKQMQDHIAPNETGKTFKEMGDYLYRLNLESSLHVIESLMDMILLDQLTEEERENVISIYIRICNYYHSLGLVKKSKALMMIAWQKLHIIAGLGSATAMHNIAFYYYKGGMGIKKSLDDARIWYKKAIKAGSKASEYQFKMYFPGEPLE